MTGIGTVYSHAVCFCIGAGRNHDGELTYGDIIEALKAGDISVDDIADRFRDTLIKRLHGNNV